MSTSGQRARDLIAAYNHFLENQIETQGSSLPCREEKLFTEVEGLLKTEDGHDTHCLGLDPYTIMEESLRSAAATDSKGTTRAGLKGLAKAFEVLEQAALNLYLGPWREEYKVVKMYSGIFTHYIKPVFTSQQIEELFSMLGYELCSKRREQLRLQPQKVNAANLDELLHLSCAFFVARCECRLLLAALGKNSGQRQWELSLVRERQRGHSLQVALDNTMRTVEVKKPLPEVPEENDVDLYTDEQDNRGIGEVSVDDEPPQSLSCMPEKSAANNNGTNGSKQPLYISTHYRQVNNPSADAKANGFSPSHRFRNHLYESIDEIEAQSGTRYEEKTEHDAQSMLCSCLQEKPLVLMHCTEYQIYHDYSCALFKQKNIHNVEYVKNIPEQFVQARVAGSQHRGNTSPTLTRSSAAFSTLDLHDKHESVSSIVSPISNHNCCDLIDDPQVLCFSCKFFHKDFCNEAKRCLRFHESKKLGTCSQVECSKETVMLCKYCGSEYCRVCWYKDPIKCSSCGQTFDMSSSV